MASSLDDYDWYTGIYNNPDNVHLERLGSTGRTLPNDVMEQAAMKDALKNPFKHIQGSKDVKLIFEDLTDERWSGWEKWQIVYKTNDGRNITIHFNYDPVKNLFDDYKFK